MKKTIVLLVMLLALMSIPNGDVLNMSLFVRATSCSTNQFTLSNINIDKSETVVGCYDTFAQANSAMNNFKTSHNDLIVTHNASRSPLKIVAASRAIAASYPFRTSTSGSNSILAYIYRNSNLSGESTYMPRHLDMAYYETVSYNTSTGTGSARVTIAGFTGFIQLIQIDIVPLIYIENGWQITLGGNTYEEYVLQKTDQEQPFTLIPRMNEYRVITNTTAGVREIRHETFSFWSGNSYGWYTFGMAPSWLPNGTYYSWDSIHFYYDRAMTQPVKDGDAIGQYFNYYTYLPLRSSSKITTQQLDAYLVSRGYTSKPTFNSSGTYTGGSAMYGEGQAFVEAQNTYGMNALLIYAMAIHESGHGTSRLARDKNNLFGWGAHDANPSDAMMFESISQSVGEHMGKNLRGYLSVENWRYFGQALGNKNNGLATKYASDPYWGNKIAGHAYFIDRYYGFVDYGVYTIGLLDKTSTITVRKQPSTSASTLMTMSASLQQQTFLINKQIKEGNNTFSETMSVMPVNDSGNAIAFSTTANQIVPYTWQQSIGYLVNEPLKIIYNGTGFNHTPNVVDEESLQYPPQATATTLTINDNKLVLAGHHVQKGLSVINANHITHKLNLVNTTNDVTSFNLNNVSSSDFNGIYQESTFVSDHMGFSNTINFESLNVGVYRLEIETSTTISNPAITYKSPLRKTDVSESFSINNKIFTLKNHVNGDLFLHVNHASATEVTESNVLLFNQINQQQTINRKVSDNITYESAHLDIASVNAQGVVTTLKSGTTTITIKQAGQVKAVIGVVVSVKVDAINVDTTSVTLTSPTQVKAIATSFIPATTTNKEVIYISKNSSIAKVSPEGVISPVSNGRTLINVYSKENPSLSRTINVTVAYGLIGISASPNKITLTQFVPYRMSLLINPINALSQSVSYTSSNTTVATVNSLGDIKPLTNGKTTITATAGPGITTTFEVTVDVGAQEAPDPDVLLGDVNGDGVIDILDLVMLSRVLAGLDSTNASGRLASDLNGDGVIDILDLVLLSRRLAGLE